ncbi:Integrase, catalytic core [Gossypium australe]|uniref:Integrase, catalytic core n=1 Tax=Gossypium australe TaxID=47621 RepID=A0A5B6WFE0_9ROSI|nr:Integrase, catalytic core [Gossypium australe]
MEEEEPNEPIEEITVLVSNLVISKPSTTKIPFSRQSKEGRGFLNLFKSLNVNLSLLELIDKTPKYAKYLKEIMARHKKMNEGEKIETDASCSALITKKIYIKVGDRHFSKALCDLGASINLMPLSIYRKLRLGDLKNTSITLQLVDRSLVYLKGVLKDVLVKLRGFIIPVDFLVLDFEEDHDIPILLGRPFLATSNSTIDFEQNELIMKINGKIVVFKYVHDPQIGECYVLFNLTPNGLD